MSALTNLHFANIWEHVSDIIPDRLAVICGNDKKIGNSMSKMQQKLHLF